jgi:hypothetical protein
MNHVPVVGHRPQGSTELMLGMVMFGLTV